MNRSLSAMTLCLLLVACKGGSSTDTPAQAAAPAATAPAAQQPAPAEAPTAAPPTPTYQFSFAAKSEDSKDPRIVDWGEDGCGRYPVVRVDSIPLVDAWLQPDKVIEFDAKGQEITRWGKPMGAEIISVGGDQLTFRVDDKWQKGVFATKPSGAIFELQPIGDWPPKTVSLKMIDCPTLPSFADSDYEQCFLMKDEKNGERRLAWEAPCT